MTAGSDLFAARLKSGACACQKKRHCLHATKKPPRRICGVADAPYVFARDAPATGEELNMEKYEQTGTAPQRLPRVTESSAAFRSLR